MGTFSNYAEEKLLNHALKNTEFTVPSNIYVALSTADPGETGGTIAEPSGNNYARVQCNTWDAAASRASANTGAITFPQASGSWGTITHFAIFDHITAGNFLGSGELTLSKAIVSGNIPSFAAGDFDISLTTGGISDYLAEALIDHILKTTAYTQPTHIYVGLSTADPTDDGSGLAEPSGDNYSRVLCDDWDNWDTGVVDNTNAITMPTASGNWGTIAYTALFDADTAGNMLFYGAVSPSQAVTANDYMEWAAGGFDLSLD